MAFFWAPIDHTKSTDKQVRAFRHIESKNIPIHEKFDETNSEHEKKGLRFFMKSSTDVYQPFGTSNNHQNTIYVSPEGRK